MLSSVLSSEVAIGVSISIMDVLVSLVVAVVGMVKALHRLFDLLGSVPLERRVICYEASPDASALPFLLDMYRLKLTADDGSRNFCGNLVPVDDLGREKPVRSSVRWKIVIRGEELLLMKGGAVGEDRGDEKTEDSGDRNSPELPGSCEPENGKNREFFDEITADFEKI